MEVILGALLGVGQDIVGDCGPSSVPIQGHRSRRTGKMITTTHLQCT